MNMNKTVQVAKVVFSVAAMLLAGSAWADYNNFGNSAMSSLSGNCAVTTGSAPVLTATKDSTFTYYDGTAGGTDGNNCKPGDRAWMVGAKIAWPNGAYKTKAKFDGARLTSAVTGVGDGGNGTFDVGSGSGVKAKVENATAVTGNVTESYWWSWITATEAYDAQLNNGGIFTKTLTMGAANVGFYKGVNNRTFTIKINVENLVLKDDKNVVWYPVVATNVAGKVYGDLNVALKAGGTICSVADAAITNAITLEAGIVYYKNGKNVAGLDKLTLLGGSYDFDPAAAGCTLGTGCIAEKSGDLWVVKPCPHDWEFSASGDTFTANCKKGCDYTPQTVTIKIDQTTKTYDGTELSASLEYNKGETEFKAQTGASVGEIVWTGDKKSAGEQKASVTITAGGTPYTISTTLTIEPADMSTTTVTMKNDTMIFADKELTNAVADVKAPGISTSDWEIVDKTALYQSGSGYSNCEYTVTLQGKGNFTGTKEVTWIISVADPVEFGANPLTVAKLEGGSDAYATVSGKTMTMTDSKLLPFNGSWFVGFTIAYPNTVETWAYDSQVTDLANLRFAASTLPAGQYYTGKQIAAEQVPLTAVQTDSHNWSARAGNVTYAKSVLWWAKVTPEMVEQAAIEQKDKLAFTATLGGLQWTATGSSSSTTFKGVRYTDFTIDVPLADFVFVVPANTGVDVGDVTFAASKMLLKTGSVVTNDNKIIINQNIYTDVDNYKVFETKVSDTCWVYSCEKEIVEITIPNVEHQASKVVKVGETEKQPTDQEKTKYDVRYGDTVTITYTAEAGYVPTAAERTMENVTGGETLTDLPVFTWPNVMVQVDEIENASKAEIYTNGVLVGESPCEVISNEMVTVVYTADEGYFFYDEQQREYSTSNKLAAVKADANPTTVSKAGALPVVAAVAKIDTTYYPTLGRALKAAKENETVKLIAGCSNETSYAVATAITLDENGFAATNVCIAATGTVEIEGATGSANKLRVDRPTLFGALENGAQVKTDETYVYVKVFDAFYKAGHEVVATTADGYLESYPKFADGLAAVATNGTVYALMNVTNEGFTVAYNMTIDLVKAADGGVAYSLTITSPARKTIGIEIGRLVSDVTFRGGTIAAGANAGITTFFSSSAANLTLDNVMIDGCEMLNDASVATKTLYALALNEGATTLTNAFVALPRADKAYALYVSCYGASTGNAVTFLDANQLKGNILVNAQNDAPVKVAFGKVFTDTTYALTVNKYNDKTAITKAWGTEYPIELTQSEFCWSSIGSGIDTLVFGKCLNLKTGKYFATLSEAFDAPAQPGETIRLCADVEESEDVHVAKDVTLDLYGHTLTAYLDVNGVPFEILGTNDCSRIVGDVWATNGANLSICGGTYDGGIRAYGSNKINIADAIIACASTNETALQLSSYGEYGASYDKDLTATVVNSRLTGYSAACIGGGTLTISNSVLTAFGAEKKSINRDYWMGGTGDALVIDQVPGCPISVNIGAGTKLQQQLDIGCEQLGWYTNAQGTVTATVKKRAGVDTLAVDGYWWAGDDILTMTKEPVPSNPTIPVPMMITKNTLNLAPAFTSKGIDPDGSVNVGGEEVTIRPEDLTITVGETADTVSFTSIPDFTYELLATDTIGGAYTVVDRVRATDTATTLTAPKTGAAARFYKVRLVP